MDLEKDKIKQNKSRKQLKKNRFYNRSIKLKLFCTETKQRKIVALIQAYRKAVNFYLKELMLNENAKLDKATLDKLINSKLSQRYKSNALKQAIGIYKSNFSKDKLRTKNGFKFNGFPVLDAKFVSFHNEDKTFDFWIKLSCLSKGNKLNLPSKKTKVLNKWMNKGELIQGCELHENYIIVWVKCKKELKEVGKEVGIDLGMTKLITTNEGQFIGKDFTYYSNKINRKKKGSLGYKRAVKEKNNYFNKCVNEIDFSNIKTLCYEDLNSLTKGKKGRRQSRNFRKKQQYWSYSKVITRIIEKSEENCVCPVYVNPRNTSRICPTCGDIAESNRVGEKFDCLACGYKQDADIVGATNILRNGMNWLRSLESLNNKSNICLHYY